MWWVFLDRITIVHIRIQLNLCVKMSLNLQKPMTLLMILLITYL